MLRIIGRCHTSCSRKWCPRCFRSLLCGKWRRWWRYYLHCELLDGISLLYYFSGHVFECQWRWGRWRHKKDQSYQKILLKRLAFLHDHHFIFAGRHSLHRTYHTLCYHWVHSTLWYFRRNSCGIEQDEGFFWGGRLTRSSRCLEGSGFHRVNPLKERCSCFFSQWTCEVKEQLKCWKQHVRKPE